MHGEKLTPTQAADQAHEFYIAGLPEEQRPSQETFRSWVSGPGKDHEIWKLLQASGVIEARVHVDPKRMRLAFEQVISRLKKHGEKFTPNQAAYQAHELYVAGLPEGQRPSQGTFRNYVSGRSKDPEIWKLLQASGVIEAQVQVAVDPTRMRLAFEQVIARLKKHGEKLTPLQVADQAHELYIAGLPEEQRPSQRTFRYYVSGPGKDPEIWKLLQASGVEIKRNR
jgi:hypothetical protein